MEINLDSMTTEEKLKTMELLWDSLLSDDYEMESPEWHRHVLEEREEKIRRGEAEFVTLEELKSSAKR